MQKMETRCCIVGGGPAGIMLGYILARAGVDVVVLEKWPDFFRDFRGDTIHPSTMEVLDELGILEEFLKLPYNETRKVAVHIGGEEFTVANFSKLRTKCPFIAFIPQWDFLTFLSQKGKAFPNFHLLMDTEATDIIWKDGRAVGVRAKNKDNELEISAELVVGADGRHSNMREKASMEVKNFGAPIDVLWFRISQKDDGTDQSSAYVDGGKMMAMLDRDNYWQCAFLIKKGEFDVMKKEGLEKFKKDISTLAPLLSTKVDELKGWEQIKLLNVKVDCLKTWYKEGLLFIGDSAHAMSPIGGVGINLAIQDAVAAGNVLVPAFSKGSPTTDDFKRIQARREFPTKITQRMQVFLHKNVLRPALKARRNINPSIILRLLNRFTFLQRIPARIIGIGFRSEHIKTDLDDK